MTKSFNVSLILSLVMLFVAFIFLVLRFMGYVEIGSFVVSLIISAAFYTQYKYAKNKNNEKAF